MNLRRVSSIAARSFAPLAVAVTAGCSGTSGTTVASNGDVAFGSGSSLVSTCNQICGNVLAQCGVASALYGECTSACDDLILVPQLCITQFAAYLACLGGATSIHCDADGQTVEISPASCQEQQDAYETCNGGPSPIAACIALPTSDTACGTASSGSEGLPGATPDPEFCVGQPDGCTAAGDVPFGIGTYCCD